MILKFKLPWSFMLLAAACFLHHVHLNLYLNSYVELRFLVEMYTDWYIEEPYSKFKVLRCKIDFLCIFTKLLFSTLWLSIASTRNHIESLFFCRNVHWLKLKNSRRLEVWRCAKLDYLWIFTTIHPIKMFKTRVVDRDPSFFTEMFLD